MIVASRKRFTYLLAVAVLLPTLLCTAVLAVGLTLSAPAPAAIGPAPPELPNASSVLIPSSSGNTIGGWWVPGRTPGGGAVVLMHAIRANRRQMIRRAQFLQERGFTTLLFDLQAYGESSGQRITFGKLEAQDAAAALRLTKSRLPDERIGALGVSLGEPPPYSRRLRWMSTPSFSSRSTPTSTPR